MCVLTSVLFYVNLKVVDFDSSFSQVGNGLTFKCAIKLKLC